VVELPPTKGVLAEARLPRFVERHEMPVHSIRSCGLD
jgi:hypothetical protein